MRRRRAKRCADAATIRRKSWRGAPPFVQDALKKKRGVRSQVGLNAQQRIENMQGAVLPGKHAGAVEGKSVLLIDDVLTTGSTAEACAKALREAGAKEIYLLTAARRDPHAHLSAPIED